MPLSGPPTRGRPSTPASLGQFAMVILLVSISVLFLAASLAVLITRSQVTVWREPGSPGLHWGTAVSTAFLLVVSWQLQSGLRAIRSNRFTQSLTGLRRAIGAALAFLFVQGLNARQLLSLEGPLASRSLFVFSYDLLVGLHALHVLGGFVPLALVYARVQRRDYSSSRHSGFAFCVQYWHYLAVIWLILLVTLACIV
jgi:cytochrome c oxidase subunit III